MTDALLGGALNATVSNRVQRLFGTGAIKVDPNFIGTLGNSTARVTVVEQIGNNLTFYLCQQCEHHHATAHPGGNRH